MSLTTQQKQLIQETFALVAPAADEVAAIFYGRLFELAPQVRPMFKSDLKDQGKKLMQTLAIVVHGLDNLDPIVTAVKALGARHVHYGAQPEHYTVVGEALLWTLEQGLGDGFTEEVREAWTAAYTLIADVAISGAEEALAQPER